jgi:endonuclease YncB( thermonuclease family)
VSAGSTVASAQPATSCGGDTIAAGKPGRILDGRTFLLDENREIRLAAIEVPRIPQAQERNAAVAGLAARDQLAAVLAGADIVLKGTDPSSDRYGRVLAFAFVTRNGVERSAQAEMLAAGYALVAARVGNRDCAAGLLAHENVARKAKLGLWGDPYYVMRQAENPTEVLADRGHFALVEGKVLSVRTSGATIYVNFGRRWSEDFTVTILKRNERNFVAAGIDPSKLAGRRIRVRGWVEERGGPWIEATRPEQIELADRD